MRSLCAFGGSLLLAVLASPPVLASPAADEIHVVDPYAHAVPPVSENSAVFMTLKNSGTVDHALVSASSPAAEVVELHTHVKDGDVMGMRKIDSIDVKAGETTVLEPGGLHVMLLGLKHPLSAGSTVEIDLSFADGSATTVVASVKALGGK